MLLNRSWSKVVSFFLSFFLGALVPCSPSWGATATFNWSTYELTVNLVDGNDSCQIGYGGTDNIQGRAGEDINYGATSADDSQIDTIRFRCSSLFNRHQCGTCSLRNDRVFTLHRRR